MKRWIALPVWASLVLGAGTASAQDAVKIILKDRGEGDTVLVKKNETTTAKVKLVDAQGNVLVDKDENKIEKTEYKETILKREGKKLPTKIERDYLQGQIIKDGKAEDLPLQGKTVLIEKTGSVYGYSFKGGAELTGAAAAMLKKEFSRKTDADPEWEKLLLPKTAVKPGDSWKLELGPIVKEIFKGGDAAGDEAKAEGTGTLLKAYNKGRKQYGIMQFKLEVPLTSVGKAPQQMKFTTGAKMLIEVNMDVCIDGTSESGTMKVQMNMVGSATLPQLPVLPWCST